MKTNLEIPEYLPVDQKKYLEGLIDKAKDDVQATFAVSMIITTIKTVESALKSKGKEVLKGAHIVIENDEFYRDLITNTDNRYRISSHYPDNKIKEKGVDLKHHSEFLIGLTEEGGIQKTWMQLEAHAVDFKNGLIRGAILFVLHMVDFLKYRYTGKNVGPCGLSEYTEKKPITVGSIKPENIKSSRDNAKFFKIV